MTIILGIDPGFHIIGYGVIRTLDNTIYYIDSGYIQVSLKNISSRLLCIFNKICNIAKKYDPNEIAIEQVFVYKNPNSAIKLGYASGVIMAACASYKPLISEYSNKEVKKSIVGYGSANKYQVQDIVKNILHLSESLTLDESDALAIAICHYKHKNNVKKI